MCIEQLIRQNAFLKVKQCWNKDTLQVLPCSVPKSVPRAVVLMKVHWRERTRGWVSDLIIVSHSLKQRHDKGWEKKGTDTTRNINTKERSGGEGGGRSPRLRVGMFLGRWLPAWGEHIKISWYYTRPNPLQCVLAIHNCVRTYFTGNHAFKSPRSVKAIIQSKAIQRLTGKICVMRMN